VTLLQQRPGFFDMVLSHWGHGSGPDGMSNGEALLRATAGLRATGRPMPPVMIFAGAGHEAENRRRALQLGAIGFTADWARLMAVIERVLADV
jgi:hypothetical protein